MRDFTTETYDKVAEKYLQKHRGTDFWGKERKDFLKLLQGKEILDVGCGPGIQSRLFLSNGVQVFGIDKSKNMVSLAKKYAPAGKFRRMDMLDLKLRRHSFNGVWCCASLFHIKKKQAKTAIKNFKKIVKKDGIIFVGVKEGAGEAVKTSTYGEKRFYAYYHMGELKKLVKDCGLKIIKSYKNTRDPDGEVWLSVFCA